MVIDSKRLKEQMYKDEKVIANTSKKKARRMMVPSSSTFMQTKCLKQLLE